MSSDVVKFAFIAGEISPALYGRSDLTKYDLGMALAENFFVDYRGGLSTRPGFEFCDFVFRDEEETLYVDFQFSDDLSNTYCILFGDEYISFIQDGAYVLEDAKACTAATNVITSAAHGYANDDWIKLSGFGAAIDGRTLQVTDVTTNTLTLKYVPDLSAVSSFPGASGFIARIYRIDSPYGTDDFATLENYQYRDLVRLTHVDHPIRNLIRNDHTDWELVQENFGVDLDPPVISSGSGSASGPCNVIFAVTSVDIDGQESVSSDVYQISGIVNYTTEAGSSTISWSPVENAVEYNIYRSVIASSNPLDGGTELGYVGLSHGTSFVDANIIPDWTKKPPVIYDPFDPGVIQKIKVLTGGSGATAITYPVTITDPDGTGFIGYAITDGSVITNVLVLDGGKGYTSPVATVGATGATFTIETTALAGTSPRVSNIYQQRQIYAGSDAMPLTVWGSQPKLFHNFSSSSNVIASDAFEFNLDSPAVSPIKHMMITRGGILLFTQIGVWLLSGGGQQAVLSPTNALAEPNTFNGGAQVHPLRIGPDILFVEGRGFAVRMLSYSEVSRVYSAVDRSILSNHLFGPDKEIIRWAYQESPYKVVWAVRSDGALMSFTVVQDEDVYAWTHGFTRGYFKDVVNIQEGKLDRIYVMTKRFVKGRWTKFIERMASREVDMIENSWCVDAGLTNNLPTPAADLSLDLVDEIYTATASASIFVLGDVGKILRAAGGRFRVSAYTSGTSITLVQLDPPTKFVPGTNSSLIEESVSGTWSLAPRQTTFGGLWHLEGETVAILGDGNVFPQTVVEDGEITLPNAVSKVVVGLPFRAIAKTLPMIVANAGIEAKRKRILGLAVRLDKSRGLKIGRSLDESDLYPIRERTTEDYGQPIVMSNGVKYQLLSTNWDPDGQTYMVQDDPLPVTLLGLVSDIEVGDDPD